MWNWKTTRDSHYGTTFCGSMEVKRKPYGVALDNVMRSSCDYQQNDHSKLLLILLLFFLSFLNKVAEFSIFSWFPARKDTEENAGRVLLNLVLWVSLIRRCAFFFSFFTEHSRSLRRQQLLSCEMSLHHNVKYQRKWQFFFLHFSIYRFIVFKTKRQAVSGYLTWPTV